MAEIKKATSWKRSGLTIACHMKFLRILLFGKLPPKWGQQLNIV
ncbi:MAG: hypothetical protein RL185_317 [Bacteroidota bacterium]|jgi:hypothetical protein